MTTMTDQQTADALYAARRERFNHILDHHELGAGDWTVIGVQPMTREEAKRAIPTPRVRADGPAENLAKLGRWVLICRSSRGHGEFASNHETLGIAEDHAGENIHEAWHPVCVYDLDALAGDEWPPQEGDRVRYDPGDGERDLYVVHASDDLAEGEVYWKVWLDEKPDVVLMDDAEFCGVDEANVTIVERADPDERLPVRYAVAKVLTLVAFNSTAEPT